MKNQAILEKYVSFFASTVKDEYGEVVVFGSPVDQSKKPIIRKIRLGENLEQRLLSSIEDISSTKNFNVYISDSIIRPGTRTTSRGKNEDITGVVFLGVDCDFDKSNQDLSKLPKVLPEPSFVINTSGSNYQLHYFLTKPERDIARVERLQKSLVDLSESDEGAKGVNRLWRLPGLLNYPTPKKINQGRSSKPFPIGLLQ